MVPTSGLRVVAGTPKTFSKTADSGKTITSHFCGDCGSTLFRQCETFGASTAVKAGIIDGPGALDASRPTAELFAPRRVAWVPEIPGTESLGGMS